VHEQGGANQHGAAEAEGKGGHGQGGAEHGGGLSESLMHHVTDGYVIEYPGYCKGHLAWDCELDLKELFGDRLVFTVGGVKFDMTPTKHLVMLWLATLVLLGVVLSAVSRKSIVPRGLYNFVEMLVQFVRNEIALKNISEKDGDRFVPYLVSAFFFILFLNLWGLLPYAATATGNLSVTAIMAFFTFVITEFTALKEQGIVGYLKHLTGGVAPWLWPIMIPVELLGKLTKPFALTVRLFANMIAGHIVILSLIGLIFALGTPWVALGSVPMALMIFLLELFIAFVQAYIFTMLSSLFIGAAFTGHHDHEEEHGDHAHAAHGGGSHDSHVSGVAPGHG
jgi:F-type H+-transporting ATPase subunit a